MIRVGMSFVGAGDRYDNYPKALYRVAAELGLQVEPIWLLRRGSTALRACEVSGIVLTGGVDVDPARYGRPEASSLCEEIDGLRDALELELIETALAREIPILAICRGMQLLNVHAGGTLIAHLDGHKPVDDGSDTLHEVRVMEDSLLARLAGKQRSITNSSHHQAVDVIAAPFRVTAIAEDGTIEAYEWRDPAGKADLLAVQWHPERMPANDPLGGGIFRSFLQACQAEYISRT
ncbi:MAG: gamma-glutamyl-gamma-aminobutyrate hydrolase family protein [Vulcanimicrobiaceae bacterium]